MDLFTNISLFSGAAGLDLAAKWTKRIRTVCYVENDRYAQAVLQSRIRDGGLDDAPIWSDVTTFDGKAWRGKVHCISGGFPCQDVSFAGKRAGLRPGTRSGLWNHFARIIREVGPRFVLVENVSGLLSLGLGDVLGDLAEMGFSAKWGVWGASDVGAKHLRKRVWIVAYSERKQNWRLQQKRFQSHFRASSKKRKICYPANERLPNWSGGKMEQPATLTEFERPNGREIERDFCGMAYGVASRVDRLRCCGNGVVPQQALPAWEEIIRLSERRRL